MKNNSNAAVSAGGNTRAIFISYRRDDAEGQAGRLFDDLVQQFGKQSVFMDVANIRPGIDFRKVIEEQVATCGVLLAFIGRSWLHVRDESGVRRIDNPSDFVRLETAFALKRDIPVVPVLVQGARMPGVEELPDDIKPLAYRNGVELSHARWDSDVALLITALMPYVTARDPEPSYSKPNKVKPIINWPKKILSVFWKLTRVSVALFLLTIVVYFVAGSILERSGSQSTLTPTVADIPPQDGTPSAATSDQNNP
jgi:hypothetical protein